MKKRIEILADSIVSTPDGIELRLGDELTAKIFVRNELPFAMVSGIAEPMAIRKMSILDRLNWMLIDFNEHDEIHRAAIRWNGANWDQIDTLLKPLFSNGRIHFNRQKATEQ